MEAEPIAMIAGVPVYAGNNPGRGGRSNPGLFLDKGIDPERSYEVRGLYDPARDMPWSGYGAERPALEAAGLGAAMDPRVHGLGLLPLSRPIRANVHSIVHVTVQPTVSRDEWQRPVVLFDPVRVQSVQAITQAKLLAERFHREHHRELEALEERRNGEPLPSMTITAELIPSLEASTDKLSFEATASEATGMAWSAIYVLAPPHGAVAAVHVSSVYMGE